MHERKAMWDQIIDNLDVADSVELFSQSDTDITDLFLGAECSLASEDIDTYAKLIVLGAQFAQHIKKLCQQGK